MGGDKGTGRLSPLHLGRVHRSSPIFTLGAALACLIVGSVAGLVAFTGEPGPDLADLIFVASYVAGLFMLSRVGAKLRGGRPRGRRRG